MKKFNLNFDMIDADHTLPYIEERSFPETEIREKVNSDGSSTITINVIKASKYKLRKFSQWFLDRTRDKRLIDLGAGVRNYISYGIGYYLLCSEVICVDPRYKNMSDLSKMVNRKDLSMFYSDDFIKGTIISKDALDYLIQQPSNSAIIMANGLFNESFVHAFGYLGFDKNPEYFEYLKCLTHEAYRVSSGLFFGNGMYNEIRKMFRNAGFKELNPYGPGKDETGLPHPFLKGGDREHPESETPILNDYNSIADRDMFLFLK